MEVGVKDEKETSRADGQHTNTHLCVLEVLEQLGCHIHGGSN